MRRSRVVDLLLLCTLLPAYLVIQGVVLREDAARAHCWWGFGFTGAQGASGHPLVVWDAGTSPLRIGDRVLRIAQLELRGLSRSEIVQTTSPLLGGGPFPVEAERAGERLQLTVTPTCDPYPWVRPAVGAILALGAAFLLLRAPHWHLARRFFAATLFLCIARVSELSSEPILHLAWDGAGALAGGLWLWCFFEWTEAARPLPPWQRRLPWLVGVVWLLDRLAGSFLTLPAGPWLHRVDAATGAVIVASGLLGLIRAYRRAGARERRQVRWVVYGLFVGMAPGLVASPFWMKGLVPDWLIWHMLNGLFPLAIPLGIAVSIVGYRYLDIDRLISATASLTVLGVGLFGGTLALVPRLAQTASAALGIEAGTGQLAFSMALAALLVPAYRALSPWLDQRLFAEQHALTQAFERLRASLNQCGSLEQLAERAGEGLDALLRPDSIATYARAGDAFTPLFVRGRAVPPAFEAHSTLVQVLEAHGAPLFTRAREVGPFERAALETLGAEVVMPVRRDGVLVAFSCLATKRSGDIYTATDLAYLAATAERCSEVLARLDAEAVAREARAMQSALRRYVPGAVAERVLRGDALEPSERDVTVLFVDIRDYTRMAERLHAAAVFATLNEHTERVSSIVQDHGGTIVEFNGDGMMAVFGAPEPLARKELKAVEAARGIVDSMPAKLAVGVGVATGAAFVGSIRSTDRLIWSAVGSTTNLASRLQGLTRELGAAIAIDEETWTRASHVCVDFVRHTDVEVRGRTRRFDVFALPLREGASDVPARRAAAP